MKKRTARVANALGWLGSVVLVSVALGILAGQVPVALAVGLWALAMVSLARRMRATLRARVRGDGMTPRSAGRRHGRRRDEAKGGRGA